MGALPRVSGVLSGATEQSQAAELKQRPSSPDYGLGFQTKRPTQQHAAERKKHR